MSKTNILLSVFIFLVLLSVSSCRSEVDKVVEDSWSMDSIMYKGVNIRYCLGINVLTFKLPGKSELPIPTIEGNCGSFIKNCVDEEGEVSITQSFDPKDSFPLRMKIDTINEIFSGTHKIVFFRDNKKKLLKMIISSDNLFIICAKGFYNFNSNINTIDYLENISAPYGGDINSLRHSR